MQRRNRKIVIFENGCSVITIIREGERGIHMSTKLTDVGSIEKIISEMTLEEKARLITGGSPFGTEPMEKYGIPSAILLDGGTGFNGGQFTTEIGFQKGKKRAEEENKPYDREGFEGNGGIYFGQLELSEHPLSEEEKPTKELGCYPPGMLFGATWNPEPIEACGHALGKEMSFRGVDCILGTPNVNIHRDPLNGRLFEGYSEDPYLVSALAPAFVKGVQAEGPVANVKHFAANNQETNRMGINEHISERALREIYFPGFRACVEAGCKTLMSAYNRINGNYCAMNPWMLKDVLRKEWDFEGFVMSDWGGAVDQVAAIEAGNDLAMPGPRGIKTIVKAVEEGRLKEEALDEGIRNFLKILLEMPVMNTRVASFDLKEAMEATEFAAKEGITLLQNDGTLPLEKNVKIAFYGKRSKDMKGSGSGSAAVDTILQTNPYDSVSALIGAENVSFGEAGEGTQYWVVTVGANGQEGADRQHMDMDEDDKAALERAIGEAKAADGKVILILNTTGPVSLMDYKDDLAAVLCAYYPGMQGGKVLADILFGLVNPSGKLPLTYPKYYRDCPTYKNFPGDKVDVWYGEGIYVGYRYYDAKQVEPLYPFGFGLSYTTFAIKDLQVKEEVNVEEEDIAVTVTVQNNGKVDGSEVVQLYVGDVVSRIDKPDKELKGFAKVFLKAGEEQKVTFTLKKEDLASFCPNGDAMKVLAFGENSGAWVTEPGEFDILVGNSSANISVSKRILVKCKNPFVMDGKTGIGEIVANAAAVKMVNEVLDTDILVLAEDPIVYFPAKPWQEVWHQLVVPHLKSAGLDEKMIEQKSQQILQGLAEI